MRILSVGLLASALLPLACVRSEPEEPEPLPAEPPAIETGFSRQESTVEGRLVRIDSTFFRSEIDRAFLGRLPIGEEYGMDSLTVIVLGHELWQRLGGGPDMIGARVEVAGAGLVVIGIMPPEYRETDGPTAWIPR